MSRQSEFEALPANVQRLMRQDFERELHARFDEFYYEIIENFLSLPEINDQYRRFEMDQWHEFLRESDDHWQEYLGNTLRGPLTGSVNSQKE